MMAYRGNIVVCLLIAAALVASSAGAQDAAGLEDRTPVLLRKSLLLTPIETAGTGLSPEVKVRVDLDDRGRVATVHTLGVEPSSEYDQLFQEVTREHISHWRYAPAIQNGKAVATTLEWTVKFQALEQADPQDPSVGLWLPLNDPTPGGAESQRARILALPLAQRKELLRQQSSVADTLLDRERRQRFDSPRFVVVSDAPDPDTARIVAGNLEAVFNVIQDLFGSRIEPQPEPFKIVVYMYASRHSFDALKGQLEVFEWSEGFYSPAGLFAFHIQHPTMESLLGVMMHEATHAFVDRLLVQPGSYLPRWLGEGFAEYVGNSEIKKGKLIPGRAARDKFVLIPGYGAVRATSIPRLNLKDVKLKIRADEGLTVEELIAADEHTFYGERRSLYYPSAWLLVHFLRHGEAGWAEQEFPAFMLYVAEGYAAVAALETVYGFAPAEIETRFRSYIQKEF